jgi:hypothetical protein
MLSGMDAYWQLLGVKGNASKSISHVGATYIDTENLRRPKYERIDRLNMHRDYINLPCSQSKKACVLR